MLFIEVSSYSTPLPWAGYDTMSLYKLSEAGYKFRVFLLLDWLPKYLLIAGGKRDGFMPFPRALVQSKM